MTLRLTAQPIPLSYDADGVARVGSTRVTLETVVEAFHHGQTAEGIVERYPALSLADVYTVIAYYLGNRDAVDAYVRERHQSAADVRRQNESRFDPAGIRERLLARQR